MLSKLSARAPLALPHRIKIIAITLCAGIASSPVLATKVPEIPSITAERVTRDSQTGDVISRDLIQYSPAGLRAQQSGADGKFEYLQNFSEQTLWMVDRGRRLVHEISMDDAFTEVEQQENVERYIATEGEQPQSSVLAVEPCIDLAATRVGIAEWRGQPVTVWQCEFADGESFSELFFNERWNMVVREERIDQTTIEITNVKQVEFSAKHFYPPEYFRKTDFRELMVGSPEIGNYSE